VIFEELSQFNFDKAYYDGTLITPETSAIKQYLAVNDIMHIPIDTFPRTRKFDESIDRLYSRLAGPIIQEAFQLRKLISQQQEAESIYGFGFLNSPANDAYLNKLDSLKLSVLKYLKDEKLDQLFQSDIKMISDREDQILRNIYDYSRENQYSEGLMFIGSRHRRTIIPLIKKPDEQEDIKLIWRFYPAPQPK
jgi:hypothetical protein